MRRPDPSSFQRDTDGSTTVEFVVVFVAFIAVMLFVVEVTLYMFFLASLEKAAEAGVRAAVVSRPVVGVQSQNARLVSSVVLGSDCGPATCASWPAPSVGCGDADQGEPVCSGSTFGRILNHMRKFNAGIQAGNVAIKYEETGIGFAGGPTVPMVTVTVSRVPYQTGVLGLLLNSTDSDGDEGTDDADVLAFLPKRSASMTGEDLAR